MKRLAGGAAVAAGLVVAGRARRRRRRAAARRRAATPRGPPRRSSGATSSTARALAGTLGYADPGTLAAGVAGHADRRCASPGAVVTRGHSLYDVDGEPAAFLLYGDAAGLARLRVRA